jgi:hypothetical protein
VTEVTRHERPGAALIHDPSLDIDSDLSAHTGGLRGSSSGAPPRRRSRKARIATRPCAQGPHLAPGRPVPCGA